MSDLALDYVSNVSVLEAGAGVGAYNTSNLALFTADTPAGSFGSAGYALYLSPTQVGVDFGTDSLTYKMAVAVFSQRPNILANGGYLAVIPLTASEKLTAAIPRAQGLIQFFGVICTVIEAQSDMLAAALVVQSMNKIMFTISRTVGDLEPAARMDLIRSSGLTKTRALYHVGSNATDTLLFLAGYAGRALSTNFSGSNTCSTMHLKDIVGSSPELTMTDALVVKAQNAGVDFYGSFQGIGKTYTSGKNKFFDQVYNLEWIIGAFKISAFNLLATTATKLAQTEDDMIKFKGVIRKVCEQGVRNGYLAPGTWTLANTFGDQGDFMANISQRGYYLYSAPLSQQAAAERESRTLPLTQVALKEAGAAHSGNILVNVNK